LADGLPVNDIQLMDMLLQICDHCLSIIAASAKRGCHRLYGLLVYYRYAAFL